MNWKMTEHDELVKQIERDLERYERSRMKPRKQQKRGKMKRNGAKIPLREPERTAGMRQEAGNE